jgi:hypothetical protein
MNSVYEDPVAPCVQIPAWIFTERKIPPLQIALLGVLLALGGEVTISQRNLAKMLFCSQETIKRSLSALNEKRIVSITHQFNSDGGKASNRYIVQPWVMGGTAND